jgi:hypothetical protein
MEIVKEKEQCRENQGPKTSSKEEILILWTLVYDFGGIPNYIWCIEP